MLNIKNETKEEKGIRLFNAYKDRLSNGGWTRFNCVEYLCKFPQIDPYKMAASLIMDGVKIYFDDTSISKKENDTKRRKVEKLLKTA